MYANPSTNANPSTIIPQHRDPVARFCLLALVVVVATIAYLAPATTTRASSTEQIILIATSTPGELPAAIGQPPAAISAPIVPQPTQSLEQSLQNSAPSSNELALAAPTAAPIFEATSEPDAPAQAVGIQPPAGDRLYWPDGSFAVGDSQLRYYPASDGTIAEARLHGSEPNVAEAQPAGPPLEQSPGYVDPAVYASLPTAGPLPTPSGRVPPRNPNRTR